MICPECGEKLKVEHYSLEQETKALLYGSRLICSGSDCIFKKEFPVATDKMYTKIMPDAKI